MSWFGLRSMDGFVSFRNEKGELIRHCARVCWDFSIQSLQRLQSGIFLGLIMLSEALKISFPRLGFNFVYYKTLMGDGTLRKK